MAHRISVLHLSWLKLKLDQIDQIYSFIYLFFALYEKQGAPWECCYRVYTKKTIHAHMSLDKFVMKFIWKKPFR